MTGSKEWDTKDTQNSILKSPRQILEIYNYRCIVKPSHRAVTVHEIIPRSQRPKDWWEFENRVPVCASCHDTIHREGAANWVDRLRELKDALDADYHEN